MSKRTNERNGNRWKVNIHLLPVKAHYFFFMAAMGPILPYLNVFGKQLGVTEVVMGTITAILPILFMLAKPAFGFFIDYFQQHRKLVFMCLITATSMFYMLLNFVPRPTSSLSTSQNIHLNVTSCDDELRFCSPAETLEVTKCNNNETHEMFCDWKCRNNSSNFGLSAIAMRNNTVVGGWLTCIVTNSSWRACPYDGSSCSLTCRHDSVRARTDCLYGTPVFWGFVVLMALGTIGFNVANSVSDAICFDMLGSGGEMKYGRQRVFGTIGFGITALLAGVMIDWWSAGSDVKDYTPAFFLVFVFTIVDIYCCTKLQLPTMPQSHNILKDVGKLLKHKEIIIFIIFATLAGINDSFIIYYLFWYLEDLAMVTNNMSNIKLLEGLVIAAETLVGEVIFFTLSGKILKRIGYGYALTMCFFFYAIRLGLVAIIPSPWWLLPVEIFLQGPTYAMCYTTIVAYASAIAPPGASATMQGLVAGMDDGFGYAVGSMMGGLLYRWLGGKAAFTIAATLSLICSITHGVLYECLLKHTMVQAGRANDKGYKSPDQAVQSTHIAMTDNNQLT